MKSDSGKRKAFTSNPRINHKVAILKRVTGKRNKRSPIPYVMR
jgi:hypothetical protein